jgi:Predicted membrane protein (DUF2207)
MITRWLPILSLFFLLCVPARAQEAVLRFESDITIGRDAVLSVNERIRVRSEQNQLREGLVRPFPVRDGDGVRIELISVVSDGVPARASFDKDGAQLLLKIGDATQPLAAGEHDFALHYRVHGAISFEQNADRLVWQATPSRFTLPLKEVQVQVHTPGSAAIISHVSRIVGGSVRSRDLIVQTSDGNYRIDAMRPLKAGEALEVDVAWLKGLVNRPSRNELLQKQLRGQLHLVAGAVCLLGMILIFGAMRMLARSAGRSPSGEPLGPAMSRLVRHGVVDDASLTATILSMATKGYLTLEHTEVGSYLLQRTWKEGDLGLIPTDRAIAESLYKDRPSRFFVTRENVDALRAAQMGLRAALQREIELVSLRDGLPWYLAIAAMVLGSFAVIIELAPVPRSVWLPALLMTGGAFYAYHKLGLRPSALRWQIGRESRGILVTLFDALSTGSSVLYVLAAIAGLLLLALGIGLPAAALMAAILCLGIFTIHKLRAPVRLGGRLTHAVEEREGELVSRISDLSPAQYEQQLPFAVALGVEQRWSQSYATAFQENSAHANYKPRWYSGFREGFDAGSFAPSLSHALREGIENAIG